LLGKDGTELNGIWSDEPWKERTYDGDGVLLEMRSNVAKRFELRR
jgi:hypothetical protein